MRSNIVRLQASTWTAVMILTAGLIAGCGNNQQPPEQVAGALAAYEEADGFWEQKNYSSALLALDRAVQSGSLNPDLYVEALLRRAKCHLEMLQLDLAEADLKTAEPGVTDLARFHVLRGELFKARGDQSSAQAEFAKAKKVDPKVRVP